MDTSERICFFSILTLVNAFHGGDFTHEQVFGETHQELFLAREAAEYLEVSVTNAVRLQTQSWHAEIVTCFHVIRVDRLNVSVPVQRAVAGEDQDLNFSVALTSSAWIPGSQAEWPASLTTM